MAVSNFSGTTVNSLQAAGKNKILNGDFGIWQRGTSGSGDSAWIGDRWQLGTDKTATVSRQTFTPGTAPVSGYEGAYFARATLSAGGSFAYIEQRIEDVRTFAGQTATLSFWAKADASVSATSVWVQQFGAGGSSYAEGASSSYTITTSWQRFTIPFTFSSISGKTIGTNSYVEIRPIRIVDGSAHTIDIWGVQIEAGSVATPFTTATGNPASELAACQRYYWRTTSGSAYTTLCTSGYSLSTTAFAALIKMPVTMRIAPTAVDYSTLYIAQRTTTSADVVVTSATLGEVNQEVAQVTFSGSGGLTANHSGYIKSNNSASAYIGLSAEL